MNWEKQFKNRSIKASFFILFIVMQSLGLSACSISQNNLDTEESESINTTIEVESPTIESNKTNEDEIIEKEEGTKTMMINMQVGSDVFKAELLHSETTNALLQQFPMNIRMQDMNGNEKYSYLSQSFPHNAQAIGQINAGDIMLYGSDCLVIFYESFHTSYPYTKLGHMENSIELKVALEQGKGEISLSLAQ